MQNNIVNPLEKRYYNIKRNRIFLKIMENKKLFITDLDGTLMTNDKTICHKDLAALERLRRNGIITAVATGRSVHSLEKALNVIGLGKSQGSFPIDYVLFSTGAGIMEFSSRDIIFQKSMSLADIKRISAYCDLKKFDYMIHRAIPHTREFLYRSHGAFNPDFKARLAFHSGDGLPLLNDNIHTINPATQVLVIIPNGAIDASGVETIKKDLSNFSVIQATSPLDHRSIWIEVFHKEVSKSKAASFLAKKLSIDRRDIISIGNDYNDEDLLAWSGKGYVVENAPERLRQDYETVGSNNESGVSMAVKRSGWVEV